MTKLIISILMGLSVFFVVGLVGFFVTNYTTISKIGITILVLLLFSWFYGEIIRGKF